MRRATCSDGWSTAPQHAGFEERAIKALLFFAALATAVFALLVLVVSVSASAPKTKDRIESLARKSYIFKTHLKDDDIKILSKKGTVTLTGLVSEESHKSLAEETVYGLQGVKSVDNRLEVRGAPPTANSDAWLKEKVKLTLLFHRSVNAGQTEIEVKDGIVTLRGDTASLAQQELTAEYARDVDGVKDVKNEMIVIKTDEKTPGKPAEKIDDVSVTAQVKMAMLLHRSTRVLHTTVKTKRGVVTVGGKAGSAAEKDRVGNLVSDIQGVKSVNNQMTIE
jgi:osmotically-inducible protein OsmY